MAARQNVSTHASKELNYMLKVITVSADRLTTGVPQSTPTYGSSDSLNKPVAFPMYFSTPWIGTQSLKNKQYQINVDLHFV